MDLDFDPLDLTGRFEPFHTGHSAVARMRCRARKVIFLVGPADAPRTTRNPWSVAEGSAMIEAALGPSASGRLPIHPLRNHLYNESQWIAGVQRNGRGDKVLNHVRVIQGDGVNPTSIRAILERVTSAGDATSNVAFGMGGVLLQRLDRDTQEFALKCSAARINGQWIDVSKDPITDQGTQSKRARMRLLKHSENGPAPRVSVDADAATIDVAE